MDTEQIKQAYITGVAARGVLRYKLLQKQAMMKQAVGEAPAPPDSAPAIPNTTTTNNSNSGFDLLGSLNHPYVQSMGTSGVLGGILGALIQGARGKSALMGALSGTGIGLGLGAGHQALMNLPAYADNNPFTKVWNYGKDLIAPDGTNS